MKKALAIGGLFILLIAMLKEEVVWIFLLIEGILFVIWIIKWIERIYRLALNSSKQEVLVFKDLEKLCTELNVRYGSYKNKEKRIVATMEIIDGKIENFLYLIDDGYFHCSVKVLDNFPIELTTDVFILAAHFNNLLNHGIVRVVTESQYVEYCMTSHILLPLLYKGAIRNQIQRHCSTSEDIYWAFQKLVEENEAPAIIIADLFKKIEDEKKKLEEEKRQLEDAEKEIRNEGEEKQIKDEEKDFGNF